MKKFLRYLLAFVFVFNVAFSSTNLVFAKDNWIHVMITGPDAYSVEVVLNDGTHLSDTNVKGSTHFMMRDNGEYQEDKFAYLVIDGVTITPPNFTPRYNESGGSTQIDVTWSGVPNAKYTVTYEPGEHGTFTSDVHSDLTSGTATPAFAGDLTHETGYTFAGWNPEVASTVTGTVTYTAQWTEDNQPEDKYTVTYAPGDHGTFTSDVHSGLTSGTATPAFAGDLTHETGYTFAGWDKVIADKVTESVTYTALWTQDPPPAEKGSISGVVFNDLNNNGIKDSGEPGLAGWKVDLTGNATASVATDANGNYSFTDLLDGSYNVNEELKSGWIKTLGGYLGIAIGEIKNILNQNFGNYKEPVQNTDSPDISITKTANVSSAHRGDIVKYTITVTNTGNVALKNVKVTDPMIEGFGEKTVDLGIDAETKSETYTVEYTVPTDQSYGKLTNTAYAVEAQYGLSVQASDDVSIIRHSSGGGTTTIEDEEDPLGPSLIPGLKVTKDVDKTVVKVGDTVKYTITVKNTGNVELTNVSVTDSMIGLSENIAKLAADETKTFVKDYVVPAGTATGTLKNTATASAVYNNDPVTASGSAVTNVKADEQPVVNIPEEETPKGGLPKTGGMPLADFFAIGSGLAALGFLLRRKQ